MEESMRKRLEATKARFDEIETELSKPDIADNVKKLTDLSKERASLQEPTDKYSEYVKLEKEAADALEIENGGDAELADFAKEQRKEDLAKMDTLEGELRTLLLPSDPNDSKNIIVEIRGAVGGDEANLFAGDLLRMYTRYCEAQGWHLQLIDASLGAAGGYSYVSFMVKGDNVYSKLKFESGAHRVQRVPKTEAAGRIHTSTATVLVMPEAEEVDVQINPADLKIDTYRSQGAGGQNVNKTESAVRITHIPTGIVVSCQTEKAQLQNKEICMRMIRAKVLAFYPRETRYRPGLGAEAQSGDGRTFREDSDL
jgi:peptide chain release factor 1